MGGWRRAPHVGFYKMPLGFGGPPPSLHLQDETSSSGLFGHTSSTWRKQTAWPHLGVSASRPLSMRLSSPVWVHLAPGTPTKGRVWGLPGEGSSWCSCKGRALMTSWQLPFPSFSMSHVSKSGPRASGSQTVVAGPMRPGRWGGAGPGGRGKQGRQRRKGRDRQGGVGDRGWGSKGDSLKERN